MSALRLAIFDMDGTLVDSRSSIRSSLVRAFESQGLEPPDQNASRKVVGLSLEPAIRRLAPDTIDEDSLAKLVEAYRQAFFNLRTSPGFDEPMFEGARETLDALQNQGWLMAIATGKARRGVQAVFDTHGIGDYFDAVLCADDGPGKPHPFMAQAAMGAVGAAPENSLMIGDSEYDMGCARNAAIRALGVSWGFQTTTELKASGADMVFDDYAALRSHLLDASQERD